MKTTYINPWHKPTKRDCGPAFYSTDATPKEYKGCLIYHRINSTGTIESGSHIFDVVKDGVCIGQYAGPNGARSFIDKLGN